MLLQDAYHCAIVDEVQDLRDKPIGTGTWPLSAIRARHVCVRYAGRAGVLVACGDWGDSGAAVQAHAAIAL